nr:immunoglobulin light chain junction region [Macaca mulatta]
CSAWDSGLSTHFF